jgi:hypothetical protein
MKCAMNEGNGNMIWLRLLGFLLLVHSVLPHVAVSQSHFWYMVDPGNDRWYYHPRTPGLFYHVYIPGTVIAGYQARYFERVFEGDITVLACSLVSNNLEGDVFNHGSCSNPGATTLLIDSPLWIGKSWQTNPTTTAEVIGEEDHTGPFGGPYHCFVIEYESLGNISRLWVSDGIGVVKQVVVDGDWEDEIVIYDAVIPVVRSTWGSLKSLYR